MFRWIRRLFGVKTLTPVWSSYTPQELPTPTDRCFVDDKRGSLVEYGCGHTQPEHYTFNLYGDRVEFEEESYTRRDICGECWLKLLLPGTIRCAKCGLGIIPGFQVSLYCDHPHFRKEWKVTVGKWPRKQVVGCARRDCEPGGFVVGHWMGDHIRLMFEQGTMTAKTLRSKKLSFSDSSRD